MESYGKENSNMNHMYYYLYCMYLAALSRGYAGMAPRQADDHLVSCGGSRCGLPAWPVRRGRGRVAGRPVSAGGHHPGQAVLREESLPEQGWSLEAVTVDGLGSEEGATVPGELTGHITKDHSHLAACAA